MKIPIKNYKTEENRCSIVKIIFSEQEILSAKKEIERLGLSENTDVLKQMLYSIENNKAFTIEGLLQIQSALNTVNMQYEILFELQKSINLHLK